ncbi:hypothetical protein SELMODRAFT_405209 [Selaginella moellendorffii]|uniref:Uncharacterized protein HANa-1 n=1 Tax=Selaginella moellendorffii TaxID=88036 RepID=D8QWL6_SELML|nr:hypothetical protein SELMODRAFT_405209 [Selaginella moellendorffii]
MEAASSPSTCLSLSSDFLSPANSVVSSSWPNSCNSSPKRGFAAANSSSCPSSPTKRFHLHWDLADPAAAATATAAAAASLPSLAVDCTLSLGNALTRSRSADLNEAPNRLSRAGSPISEPAKTIDPPKLASPPSYQQSGTHWATSNELFLQQQRAFSAEAAARRIAAAAAAARFAAHSTSKDFYARHPVLHSQFPAANFSPSQELHKFGFLEFNTGGSGGGGGNGNGGLGSKNNLDPCSTRSRFRGVDAHVDPRNVPRICAHCGTSSTPLWRNGPLGPKSLCNACGIRFKKVGRRSPVTVTPVTAAAWNQSGSSCDDLGGFAKSRSDTNLGEQQQQPVIAAIPPKTSLVHPAQAYHVDDKRLCRMDQNAATIAANASAIALPFAKEWSSNDQSPCSSNAVGSSCITWQDSMPPAVCVDQPGSEDCSKAKVFARPDPHHHHHHQHHSPLVLDAEIIRSVAPVKAVSTVSGHGQSKEEQGRFLRMSL